MLPIIRREVGKQNKGQKAKGTVRVSANEGRDMQGHEGEKGPEKDGEYAREKKVVV